MKPRRNSLSYTRMPSWAKYRAMSPNDVDGSAYISNINRAIFAVSGSGIIIFVRMPWMVVGSSLKP